ncbi:MAG: hypothetical protein FWC59_02425, partial [Actinomycetia bacterium]|nr:hypothetical protein [Actinomycetes bacterium]
PATGLPVARSTELDRALVLATDRVRDRFGEQAVAYGRELRFRQRDTGTIGQHKDDYKDPLHPPTDPGTKPRPDPPDSSKQQTLPENGDAMMDASATIPESGD